MIVNLGCGDNHMDGAVNVDFRGDVADVTADVFGVLPFDDETVDHIYALDILEHCPRDKHLWVLREWARITRPGGALTLKVPNLTAIGDELAKDRGDRRAYALIENIYGGHRWGPDGAWDTHHWGWTPATLDQSLRLGGWAPLSNDGRLNMTVEARRV